MLSPFVYWGQTESTISLRVDLKNVNSPMIDLTENTLKFIGNGSGAKGVNQYFFTIDFLEPVEPHESFYKIIERDIEFVLKKKESKLWSRLFETPIKPAWLKVDFDKMHTEDSEEENIDEWQRTSQNSFRDIGNKDFVTPEEFRKVWLFLYNMFQFVGFTFVLLVLTIRYAKEGPESMIGSYDALGRVMKFMTLMQILEVAHPLFGYTNGSALLTGMHLGFRVFMIFIMVDAEPRMQTKPVVFYLFCIYTALELIKYPYYMLRVFKVNVAVLTWLRYSIWMPLLPIAFVCEGVILLRNIPYFDETGKYSVALPNNWNFSFSLPTAIRVYLLTAYFPAFYMFMSTLFKMRQMTIGSKRLKRGIEKAD